MTSPLRTLITLLLVVGLLVLTPARNSSGQQPLEKPSAADADRFEKKLLEITRYGAQMSAKPFRSDRARRTVVTEAETNAYLRLRMPSQLPPGLIAPYIIALEGGRVSARAVVDLDAVRRGNAAGTFDLVQLLTGRLPVVVTGVLKARSGIATFELESASISGIPIPKTLLQQVVTYYSRSAEFPNGVSLDGRFVLPATIRQIDIQSHQAVIVQ